MYVCIILASVSLYRVEKEANKTIIKRNASPKATRFIKFREIVAVYMEDDRLVKKLTNWKPFVKDQQEDPPTDGSMESSKICKCSR